MAEVTLKKGQKPNISISLMLTDQENKDEAFLNILQPYIDRAEEYKQCEVAVLPVSISTDETFKGISRPPSRAPAVI